MYNIIINLEDFTTDSEKIKLIKEMLKDLK